MKEQFHIEEGYDTERQAIFASRQVAIRLVEGLKAQGYTSFSPPPRPDKDYAAWDQFNDCRIIVMYILPFLPSRWADKFALRVDVLAEKP